MLAVQRSDSPRKAFLYLYTVSDEHGFFELDAAKIADQTGLSRKTVYKAIAFLQRVRLLFLREARTGRGQHSLYQLNWRKPAKKLDPHKHKKQRFEITELAVQKKCHPLKYKGKEIHPSGDGAVPISEIISPVNRQRWNRCMKAFRQTLESSKLPRSALRACTGVLGRHLKGKSRGYALRLFEKLRGLVPKLKVPEWVHSVVDLCRWFMGVLKGLLKPKPRLKRHRFRDLNEYLRYLHEQEVERVRRKRAEYEQQRSWAERWQEWARQQLQELAWRKKQAELICQHLRALPEEVDNTLRDSEQRHKISGSDDRNATVTLQVQLD